MPNELRHLTKLPKWAQEEIAGLKRELKNMTEERDELRKSVGEAVGEEHVGVGIDMKSFGPRVFFGPREKVRWQFQGHDHIDVRRTGKNTINICASRRISIWPSASNSFEIEVE